MLLCVAAFSSELALVIAGLALVGIATFFAQAGTIGFVSHSATWDRAAASGLYLAAYHLGGLTGAAMLGQVYDGSAGPPPSPPSRHSQQRSWPRA